MEDFGQFLQRVKRLEGTLWKSLMGTSLFSAVLVAGQLSTFSPSFNALTEICGVIAGIAGILPLYVQRLKHVADRDAEILNFYSPVLGIGIGFTLALSIVMFYFYYILATKGYESCLFLMVSGTFCFFLVLGQVAHHFYMFEQQELMWNSMSLEQRTKWRDRRRQIVKDTESFVKEAEKRTIIRRYLRNPQLPSIV